MTLTESGKKYVAEFVREYVRGGQNLDAWYEDAERCALSYHHGETGVVIEVGQSQSKDGRTHDLMIPPSMFLPEKI